MTPSTFFHLACKDTPAHLFVVKPRKLGTLMTMSRRTLQSLANTAGCGPGEASSVLGPKVKLLKML